MLTHLLRTHHHGFWLTLLVTLFAARVLLPWQSDLPAHSVHRQVSAQQTQHEPHNCGHAEDATPTSVHDETGSCQIRCDLATAIPVLPAPNLYLSDLPETRTATQPVLLQGRNIPPDHPPPIA